MTLFLSAKMTKKTTMVFLFMCFGWGYILLCHAQASPTNGKFKVRVNVPEKTIEFLNSKTPIKIAVLTGKSSTDVRIKVTGLKSKNRFKVLPLNSPTRLLVDFLGKFPAFKTAILPVNIGTMTELRVGHHPKKTRLVLTFSTKMVPRSSVVHEPDGFVLIVQGNEPHIQIKSNKNDAVDSAKTTLKKKMENSKPDVGSKFSKDDLKVKFSSHKEEPPEKQETPSLFKVNSDDTDPAASIFLKAISHYNTADWGGTIAKLEGILKQYPGSSYAEKAWFLLPIIYEKIYADSLKSHYRELLYMYQDVLSRFPNSSFTGEAMLRIGNLHKQMKNYSEAQGYYNLAVNDSPPASSTALQAKLEIARIFRVKKKEREAEALLKFIIEASKDTAIKSNAMMALAKVRYDQGSFRNSLDLLSKLLAADPHNIYKIPEVSLYLGDNYFQLGQNPLARNKLFLFYNMSPENEGNSVILARIGETYLKDGRIKDAVHIFLFVCKRYPGSRGANISWIRLAEQQEANSKVASLIPLSSMQIYQKVYGSFLGNNENDPFAMLAMLKLGVLLNKEKSYDKSLNILKKFFKLNPQGSLRENGIYALQETLKSLILHAMENDNPRQVISVYEREKKLFEKLFVSDPIFLTVARAYLRLGLEEKAMALFQRIDSLLHKKEKPEDLLYYMSKKAFQDKQVQKGQARLTLLLKKFPKGKYAGKATILMADSLYKQKKYNQAMEMFDAALKYELSGCQRTNFLVLLAKAAMKTNNREKAITALTDAEENYQYCSTFSSFQVDEIGDLFFELGALNKAVGVFTRIVNMKETQVKKASLKYKIAHCLELLGRKEESVSLYKKVSDLNDPFWSNLAREKIAASEFSKEIKKPTKNIQ